MIKFLRVFAILLALLLAPTVHAQSIPPVAVPVAHPALWKVTGANATIYLFGTVHLLPADVRWLDGSVAQAFGHADTLVTETLEPAPAAIRAILAAKAMLPAGPSLRDALAPDDRRRLEAALTADGLPVTAFDRFRPWYAAIGLAAGPMRQMGLDPANGVDHQLGKLAAARSVSQEALETMEFQLGLFANLPPPLQKTYLMNTIRQLPDIKPELTAIIEAWEIGKADELARLMNADEDKDDPQMMQILLFNRNKAWAKWIQRQLAKPERSHEILFIAVGAGHLAGPGSLQDQLRALGIASQRVQ